MNNIGIEFGMEIMQRYGIFTSIETNRIYPIETNNTQQLVIQSLVIQQRVIQ